MGVFKRIGSSKHVVNFFPLEVHLVLVLGLDAVDVGAGPAEKSEVIQGLLRKQNV